MGELLDIAEGLDKSLVEEDSMLGLLEKIGSCPPKAQQDEVKEDSRCQIAMGSQKEDTMASEELDGASPLEEETDYMEIKGTSPREGKELSPKSGGSQGSKKPSPIFYPSSFAEGFAKQGISSRTSDSSSLVCITDDC